MITSGMEVVSPISLASEVEILVSEFIIFFFSSRRRHTRFDCDWSSDVCSSDLSRLRLLHQAHAGEATLAEQAFLEGTRGMLDERALAWHRAAALLQLTERLPIAGRGDWRARAHALLAEAMRLAKHAAPRESIASRRRAAFRFKSPALELVLQALSTRPATQEELEQIRKLLSEDYNGAP